MPKQAKLSRDTEKWARQQVAFLKKVRKIAGFGNLKRNFYTRFIPENYGFGAVTWLKKEDSILVVSGCCRNAISV